ncbi:MAG: hypothetical protein K0Q43_167 [Ramlibacter sp.]|nr:hypothetical protein [Ramlibacter sp.]
MQRFHPDHLRTPLARFHSELANVIFNAPAPPERAAQEARITRDLLVAIEAMHGSKLFRLAPYIDITFIGGEGELAKLSGANRLAIAKAIEAKCPAAIPLMPNLGSDQQRLRNAAHLARVLGPDALKRLVDSITYFKANNGG